MITRLLFLLSVLALAGCATSQTKVETQRVAVPVPVSCVDLKKVPPAPSSRFSKTEKAAPVDDQVRALLIDREAGDIYGKRVRALLEACAITDATSSADRSPSPVKP